ncbi:hypothetical protein TNCT_678761 [Trichonephila clavata]|uniref:Uncharacterized protein n=1 Tax=Trichonephila clavata TaxID=2740835 RepID=A0A8X6LUD9_TRICU|nr:hypothetical protein TNCT_678761 [Trichonephila clavata]
MEIPNLIYSIINRSIRDDPFTVISIYFSPPKNILLLVDYRSVVNVRFKCLENKSLLAVNGATNGLLKQEQSVVLVYHNGNVLLP